MTRALLVAIFLAVPVAHAAKAPRWREMDEPARAALHAAAPSSRSLPARLAALSSPFADTPYAESPLGEGAGHDTDPRLRWDAVDCVTFVETVLALAAVPSLDALLPVLDDVRYGEGVPAYAARNHFVEAQWVPNNVRKGWIVDASRRIGGERTVRALKTIDTVRWNARRKVELALAPAELPSGTFGLDVVPLAVVRERMDEIPSGTIAFIVRRDFYTHPTRVTHVGFVFGPPGGKVLRHASHQPYGRVVDEPLPHFLDRNARYDRWPVDGFALFEPRIPSTRVASILGGTAAARAESGH